MASLFSLKTPNTQRVIYEISCDALNTNLKLGFVLSRYIRSCTKRTTFRLRNVLSSNRSHQAEKALTKQNDNNVTKLFFSKHVLVRIDL